MGRALEVRLTELPPPPETALARLARSIVLLPLLSRGQRTGMLLVADGEERPIVAPAG